LLWQFAVLKVLQQEKEQGLSDRVYVRCALQILMCRHLGFAGVHLSACHQPEEQVLLEGYIEEYRHLSFAECERLWNSHWQVQTGTEFHPKLAYYSRPATSSQIIKYQHLHLMHDALFESKLAKGVGRFIFNFNVWDRSRAKQALLKTEHLSKHVVVGCESCGQCRLGETLYICPETCPKGLANGPCGGTSLDRCEFGDRECIHSVKARLAKAVGQTKILKEKLIPTVSIAVRGTSSWKNWYVEAAG
jgi:methylenetetrahydrofolate reductase (NADPH)